MASTGNTHSNTAAAGAGTTSTGGGASGASALVSLPSSTRLSPLVHRILGFNPGPMTLQGTNTYLIGRGEHRFLLDTGDPNKEEYTTLLKSVLEAEKVTRLSILLTHWHRDHTGGLADIVEKVLPADAITVYKIQGSANVLASVSSRAPQVFSSIQSLVDGQKLQLSNSNDLVNPADAAAVANDEPVPAFTTVRVIHTPGHTVDHACFFLEEEGVLFSGDTILGQGSAVFEELGRYMASLRALAQLPSIQHLYPAHGPALKGDEARERIVQYISHREQREQQIVQAMREIAEKHAAQALATPTAMEIVQAVYKDLAANLALPAANNVLHHLDKLLKEGKVKIADQPTTSDPAATAAHAHAHAEASPSSSSGKKDASVADDDCAIEVAKAHAIARQKAEWRWALAV